MSRAALTLTLEKKEEEHAELHGNYEVMHAQMLQLRSAAMAKLGQVDEAAAGSSDAVSPAAEEADGAGATTTDAALPTGEEEVAAPSAVAPPAPSQPSAPGENKLDGLLKQLEHRADALREPLRAMDEAATKALERGREGIVRGLSELSMRLRPEERTLRDGAGP